MKLCTSPHRRAAALRALVAAAAAAAAVSAQAVVPAASVASTPGSTPGSTTGNTTYGAVARPAPVYPRADGITIKQAIKHADATTPNSCDHGAGEGQADCGAIVKPITSDAESQVSPQTVRPDGAVFTTYGSYFSAPVIRPMYGIPADATSTETIAIITVGSDPLLSARLNHFRQTYHLVHDARTGDVHCTAANGCLTEIPGDPRAKSLPPENSDWTVETNLDTQAISAVCPTCNILVVDAANEYTTGIEQAVVTAVNQGAHYVSMSLGSDDAGMWPEANSIFRTPGVAFFAASGDNGFQASWPATAPGVLAVGGTHTTVASNGRVINTAWEKAGAGCSDRMPASGEAASNRATVAACGSRRASADLAALADPNTGLIGYLGDGSDSSKTAFGGTSLAAPLVAAMYALAGNHTDTGSIYANAAADTTAFSDVTSVNGGGAGVLGCPSGVRVCRAAVGWDGPTGLGVPTGLRSLMAHPGPVRTAQPSPVRTIVIAGTPKVAGAPKVGKKLKAKVPAFRAKNGAAVRGKVSIVWYVDGHQAKAAKHLKLRKAWRGKKVIYAVTVSAPGYRPATAHSRAVKVRR